ncbi:hypothetical protein AAEX28_04570 [Lentisphaerota bacterium WC36G]|nr:hypothetical protein LJT99_07430 [Lentisphaerae bacterium WC36]
MISGFLGNITATKLFKIIGFKHEVIAYKLIKPQIITIDKKSYLMFESDYANNYSGNLDWRVYKKIIDDTLIVTIDAKSMLATNKNQSGTDPLYTLLIPLENKKINIVRIKNNYQEITLELAYKNNQYMITKTRGIE